MLALNLGSPVLMERLAGNDRDEGSDKFFSMSQYS